MCNQCVEIDKTIERYRNIQGSINDRKTSDGVEKPVANLEAKTAALHPERNQ
jgi:hypothetical protein